MAKKATKRSAPRSGKMVYYFGQIKTEGDGSKKELLGGKGANLADMVRIGIPVPPGFTVTTEACNAFLDAGEKFPGTMWDQEVKAIHGVEEQTGKKFGDPNNPLLVSCRSGAKFSMPGMMDTVLNIGLNDETATAMVKLTGDERFVFDAYRRLINMFGDVVMGVDPQLFEDALTAKKSEAGADLDTDLSADDLRDLIPLAERWGVGGLIDYAGGELRNLVVAVPIFFHATRHLRFVVAPGTDVGTPASRLAIRATLRFSSPAPLPLPRWTSSSVPLTTPPMLARGRRLLLA